MAEVYKGNLTPKEKLSAVMNFDMKSGGAISNLQQNNLVSAGNLNRPSMKEDDHPDHNMPAPEHDGTTLGTGDYISKLKETNASNYSIQPGK